MSQPVAAAYRILGHFWLEEPTPADLDLLQTIPELADTLSSSKAADLDELAVEYQRLFGFNLPPYESIFVDPSAMLMAPATMRVQTLYRDGRWQIPNRSRTGAPDHIGLELLALAAWLDRRLDWAVNKLYHEHLALWLPPFVLTLRRLSPHPFYAMLADLTLDLVLSSLPAATTTDGDDPFPALPPPPVYRGTGWDEFAPDSTADDSPAGARPDAIPLRPDEENAGEQAIRLRDVVKRLLPPRETGIFLTREDIGRVGQTLSLPASMGDRFRMLETLFRQAGEYGLVSDLLDGLGQLVDQAGTSYQTLALEYPAWSVYGSAWQHRLNNTRATLDELAAIAVSISQNQP
jgi:TorA maturation chaperone TorD